jgi:glycosyltransferase involved in cell wall biosynthesis
LGRPAQLVERALGARTSSVIAVSERQLGEYLSHFPRTARHTVIRNGVRRAVGEVKPLARKPRVVATLARVALQKRPAFWREVVELSETRAPHLSFEWWGPLSGDKVLDDLVLSGLPSNARYMGETQDVASVLTGSDIILHTADREAASIALLEAACAGRPVIYANTLRDQVEDAPYWRHAFDSSSPSSALDELLDATTNWTATAGAASVYALEARSRFGAERVADEYLAWILEDEPDVEI